MQPAAAAHPRQLMRQKMNLLGALMEDPQFTARNDGQPHRRPTGRGNHSRGNVLLRGPQPSDTWTTAESSVEVLPSGIKNLKQVLEGLYRDPMRLSQDSPAGKAHSKQWRPRGHGKSRAVRSGGHGSGVSGRLRHFAR